MLGPYDPDPDGSSPPKTRQKSPPSSVEEAWGADGPNGDGLHHPPRVPRKLTGASLFDYSKRTINEKDTLLGNRYLCRAGGWFIVAPSGHGKSVLVAQAAVELGYGKDTFGIKT